MSALHHPSDDLLLSHAGGGLGRGPALLVQTHLRTCPACRRQSERFEAVGGALLETLPPAEMAPDALAQALAGIDRPETPGGPPEPARQPRRIAGIDLTEVLGGLELGPRRPLGRGLWMREILREGPGVTYLLGSGPGRRLPRHSHTGMEYVQVLTGAFSDETGRYAPGDFAQSDDSLIHGPVTDSDGECLCLISAEGPMLMQSLLGKVAQPFVGL